MTAFLKKCTLILLIINGFPNLITAQKLTAKQETTIRKTIEAQYGDYNSTIWLNTGMSTFCVVNKDTLYNPDGFHYVFKLSGDSAIRLDHSIWHGGNFRRFLFSDNDNLYALGGYGFFTTNNNLEYFNPKIKEWSFKQTFGNAPNYILGMCFKIGDDIYSMNNMKSGNGYTDAFDTLIYKLNLKTMTWESFYQKDKDLRIYGQTIYTNDYCIHINLYYSIIIKKGTLNYLSLFNEDIGFSQIINVISINNNTISFQTDLSSHSERQTISKLKLDEIWKKNIANVKPLKLFPITKPTQSLSYTYWLLAFLAFSSIPIMTYYYKKRKKNKIIIEPALDNIIMQEPEKDLLPEELQSDVYKALLNYGKLNISTDELDELLAISHLEPDSKKLKRHRLLSKIEKKHPGFIVRIKDQIDKRQFSYQINKT